jgi:hypothetical protein
VSHRCSRRLTALALVALLAACDKKPSTRREASGASASAPAVASSYPAPDAAVIAISREAPPWRYDCSEDFVPRAGKSVGHTSVVFKLELANGRAVAWKPNAKRVKLRYKGEIAAYRLAEAMGVAANVIPACATAIDATAAAEALQSNPVAARLLADEAIIEDGKIYGARMPWLDGLRVWPLEKDPLRTEVKGWLTAGAPIPKDKVDLARQMSTLVAFDSLTGNWDRYSGENVGIVAADHGGIVGPPPWPHRTGRPDDPHLRVLYLDNDAAFMEGAPKAHLARNKAVLEQTDRFSRSFIAAARSLDEARLASVFGEEAPGRPLLAPAVIRAVAERVKELLAVVDAKIAARGAAETLYFD